ncbi:hypothetical protein ACO0SA_000603 [Hanseniaspora valbyensis]|uniref:Uncharacterized protein n=1 Tax=Hanseniaspora valbyensis NRRL Y-1626 TaxID=766949 RepID=A0A1B7TCQ8_9ASCO|nr:hypothetical protein HANVADRAFT_53107 [Hanseniaspora valbyensis NRRL Y-1626]
MGFKETLQNVKYWFSASPQPGKQYKEAPAVKDLPHIVDADGVRVVVSNGKRELSPVLSSTFNIKNAGGNDKIDDNIAA